MDGRFRLPLMVTLLFSKGLFGALLEDRCRSKIYCSGALLDMVQTARIFNDSKTFVDLKIRSSEEVVLGNFEALLKDSGGDPSRDQIRRFVDENFEEGDEVEEWRPPDYVSEPKFLANIKEEAIREFAKDIVAIWPTLGRKIKATVMENPRQYSIIEVRNGFIVAGGRFSEYYYWDTYWIIKGLLLCEMKTTVRGILNNFLELVGRFGFIPNGGRVYYLNRSQPPLLTSMAYLYVQETGDVAWLDRNIVRLEKELGNFIKTHGVGVRRGSKKYAMARYFVASRTPRPESYAEDVETASVYQSRDRRAKTYQELKSGAESGWDFSSRWIFDQKGGNEANLSEIETGRVVPVDLNSFLCKASQEMAKLQALVAEDGKKSRYWNKVALDFRKAIKEVLWNPEQGIFNDFDLKTRKHRGYFYPSNLTPLWAGCVDASDALELGKMALKYLKSSGIFQYYGGTPASLLRSSGQQWDFPNAWAPLQDIVIGSLESGGQGAAAETLAKLWIKANMIGYRDRGAMFEKYDATEPGSSGGGGEYEVQTGFGWTNGLVLDLINSYYGKK